MSTTDKALNDNKLSQLALGGGGSCVGSVGVMAFLAILAKYKHQSYKEDSI